jgi:hypothetical protein
MSLSSRTSSLILRLAISHASAKSLWYISSLIVDPLPVGQQSKMPCPSTDDPQFERQINIGAEQLTSKLLLFCIRIGEFAQGIDFEFQINGETFTELYWLADGIYAETDRFATALDEPSVPLVRDYKT